MNLHREVSGSGPDLVLLHGWGMNSAVWQPIVASFSSDYRVTSIELPGHGNSPVVKDPQGWVAACLAAAPSVAYWVGWSLGGQLAVQAARRASERIVGLSLIATTPKFVRADDWSPAMPSTTFAAFARSLEDDPDAALLRFLSLQVKGDEHARATLRQLRDELEHRPSADPVSLKQGLKLLQMTDLRDRLGDLVCPQQWMFGERDTLVPVGLADWVAENLPGARVDRIAGAGHAPFLSHPEQSERLLREAIDGTR